MEVSCQKHPKQSQTEHSFSAKFPRHKLKPFYLNSENYNFALYFHSFPFFGFRISLSFLVIMGQNLEPMSQQRPRAELLHKLVRTGNVEAIKALCREGASLEVNLTMLLDTFFFFLGLIVYVSKNINFTSYSWFLIFLGHPSGMGLRCLLLIGIYVYKKGLQPTISVQE